MNSEPSYKELEQQNEILRQKLEISETNEKFKFYFDFNKAIMLQINSKTKQIINANEAAVNFYGYSKNKLLQKSITDINTLPPDEIDKLMKKAVKNKSNFFQFQHKLADGKIKDVEVYASTLNIDDETFMIITVLDITDRKKTEQALFKKNNALNKLNQFALELSNLSSNDNLETFIAKQVKEITGAKMALFSEYNSANQTSTPKHIEVESGLLKKILRLIGTKPQNIQAVISEEVYREMTNELIGIRKTLYEASFGEISRPVGAAIQALLKVDRFIGLAYLIEGKLYGTSLLAMGKGQPDPPKEILENFIHLASVSLRRKQTDKALQESKQKFESMILNSPDLIMSQNANGKLEYLSPQCENILGYTAEEIENIDLSELVHPDYKEKITEIQLKTLRGVETNNFEYRFFKKNDDVVWLNHSAKPISVDGKITKILSTVRDITKGKLDAAELQESNKSLQIEKKKLVETEKYIKMLFSSTPIGLALTNLSGDLTEVNIAYANIIGYSIEEVLKLSYWDITPEKYKNQENKQLESLNKNGVYGPYEKEYIHKSGKLIPVRLQGKIIEREGNKYIWSSVENISDKKDAELKLLKQNHIFPEIRKQKLTESFKNN